MVRNLSRLILIATLSITIAAPVRSETLTAARDQIVIGIVVVGAAIGVGITLLVLHEKHKKIVMTGCVASTANGMTVSDDKDKRIYGLSGNPVGVKAGERMTFEGKRKTIGNMPAFEALSVTKDLGACLGK